MKIQIASDLHLEFLEKRMPHYIGLMQTDADVLVLAGDIHKHAAAISIFNGWNVPVIYVHGNHELYAAHHDETVNELRVAAADTNVRYLECDEYIQGGVRFLGCCLWTDYRLFSENTSAAMREAEISLNDHRLIRTDEGGFTARDAARIHAKSRSWLEAKLDETFDGPTIVVTHHAPHPCSIHSRYRGSVLSAAFASNLSPLIERADVWIHGHVHDSFDYTILGTRIIANPRGYALSRLNVASPEQLEWENAEFDPAFVLEVG